MPAITVTEHIDKAVRKIDKSTAIDHWDRNLGRYDAEELMSEVLGRTLTKALLERVLDGTSKKRYAAMVARRIKGEPIPRIKGHYAFRGLDLLDQGQRLRAARIERAACQGGDQSVATAARPAGCG